jgi:hypothetical protein
MRSLTQRPVRMLPVLAGLVVAALSILGWNFLSVRTQIDGAFQREKTLHAATRRELHAGLQRLFAADATALVLIAGIFMVMWVRDTRLRKSLADLEAAYQTERNAAQMNAHLASRLQKLYEQEDLPVLNGVSLSSWYQAAAEGIEIGGDWYKAVRLDEDRMLLGIGDVSGHGIDAALTMGKVRRLILTSALVEKDPTRILESLNSAMLAEGQIVTALLGILSVRESRVTYAIAGHCQPILVAPDGRARFLSNDMFPLGVQEHVKFRCFSEQLEPGSRLILYTDGLLEFKRAPIETEPALLDAASCLSDYHGRDFAERFVRAIIGSASPPDDVAVLAVSILEQPSPIHARMVAVGAGSA